MGDVIDQMARDLEQANKRLSTLDAAVGRLRKYDDEELDMFIQTIRQEWNNVEADALAALLRLRQGMK